MNGCRRETSPLFAVFFYLGVKMKERGAEIFLIKEKKLKDGDAFSRLLLSE